MSSESSGNGSSAASSAAAANASSAAAAAAAVPAAAHAALGKIGVIRLEADYKHPNSMSVEEFFSGNAAAALGRSDFSAQVKLLSQHMVETVADLRLLVSESQLRELGLPIRLCVWIEEEIAKLGEPVGGVNVSVPNQTPSLPPIPLSAPIVPKPQPAAVSLPPIAPVSAALLASPDKVGLLQFAHDFDQQGVMYYLGSRGCTTVWSNPMEAGYVNVTASSVSANSAPLSAIVGRETVRCVTNSGDASFIQVEIKDFFIKPTNYSLKHYSSYDSECLRDWKLEGSVDGSSWVLLKEHKGDTNLNSKGATCTWNITPDEPQNYNQTPSIPFASPQGNPAFASQLLIPSLALSSTKHWYRYFRVTMLGPNSNQHTYLACSGLEIYGYLLSKNQM